MPALAAAAVPLVLVPALLCDDALYRDVLADLGGCVAPRVVVADWPDMAANVAAVLDRAPERFVLVGSSYGGTVAVEVALAAPDRVRGLVLAGSDPGASEGALGLATLLETSPDAAVAHLAGAVVRPQATDAAAEFRAMAGRVGTRTGAAQARALAGRTDAWDRLGALGMPALVLWGDADALVPLAVGQRLAAALPQARLEVIPECGHLAALERPGDVARHLRAWLDQVPAD